MGLLPREISSKMLMVALGLGEGLVKKLGATGVTYLINEGKGSGQTVSHASINVIPRYDNDGVTIGWEEKQLNQEEVNKYLQGIIAKLQSGEAPKEVRKETAAQSEKPKQPPINLEERVPKYW